MATTDLARTGTVSYSNNFGATINAPITNVNDGNDASGVSESQVYLGGQPGPFDRHFEVDLGSRCYVVSMELLAGAGASGFDGFGFLFYIAYSDDGVTWTDVTSIVTASVLGEGPTWQAWGLRYTFTSDGDPHRYWRVGGRHDAPFGWTSGMTYMTWRVTGMVAAALASGMPPGLIVEYLTHDPSTFGPLKTSGIITEAVKVGWSWYSRYPSNAFFTLRADNIHNARLLPLRTHIRIWYHNPTTGYTVLVFSGKLVEPDANGNDIVWTAWSYLSELSLSRTGYRTMYQNKLIGTEIAAVEWNLAKTAVYSPLAFVATGTIEDPLGTDGSTKIKTDARFGVIDVPRLLLMFDLTEIGRANTDNNVTMGITRTPPHTFFFLKNAGSVITSRRLTYPGNIRGYRYIPGYGGLRNDLATIGTSTDGGAVEIVKTDEVSASTYGRRQDVFQIKTLAGQVGGATELDAQNAITARAVKEAVNLTRMLQLDLRPFAFEPFNGWDIEDTIHVEIPQENIDTAYRIVGARGVHDERGYHPQLFVTRPTEYVYNTALVDLNLLFGTVTSESAFVNPARANDGSDATYAEGLNPASSDILRTDLGKNHRVTQVVVRNNDFGIDVPTVLQYSLDGSTWTTPPGGWVDSAPFYGTWTLATPISARYWRMGWSGHPIAKVYTWTMYGYELLS